MTVIEGFVLAGGASSRMGRPKVSLALGSNTLLERTARVLSKVSNQRVTALVAEDFQNDGAAESNFRIAQDLEIQELGRPMRAPIVGLYSALQLSSCPWIAVLAVDLPFATAELFMFLSKQISDDIDVIVPVQEDGHLQPLCALYRTDIVLSAVKTAIHGNDISIHGVISKLEARKVGFAEFAHLQGSGNFFQNLNTPSDYELALSIAAAA